MVSLEDPHRVATLAHLRTKHEKLARRFDDGCRFLGRSRQVTGQRER